MNTQELYQKTIVFATKKHLEKGQTVPDSNLPYVVHLSNVAMEIMLAYKNSKKSNINLTITLALLHDTLEDTNTTFNEITDHFGIEVAEGVFALTKNSELPKDQQIKDSLKRILKLKKEVWCVKLADRITNLQQPPGNWDKYKIRSYLEEAKQISEALKGANNYLEKRLKHAIDEYEKYIID